MQLTRLEIQQALAPYLFSQCEWSTFNPSSFDRKWEAPVKSDVSVIVSMLGRSDWVRPVLTPLASITDEHAVEVAKLSFKVRYCENNTPILHFVGREVLGSDYKNVLKWEIREYLISKGYAVPLWFGLNHWANGKTAIELEIAIEKQQ